VRIGRLNTIFAKRPLAGRVKTRLCPPLLPEEAAELALAMLDETMEKCLRLGEMATTIRAGDAEDVAWFRSRFPAAGSVEPQRGGDLGARLADHFEECAREERFASWVVVGTDAPQVPGERIEEAHRALEGGADLVLGPDLGGGYYLVGLRRSEPRLFLDVPMSTSDMCARTIDLARELGMSVQALDREFDVDLPEDLERLARCGANLRSVEIAARLLSRRR
jgi:rSAM/selenodomain-associated transferase 1